MIKSPKVFLLQHANIFGGASTQNGQIPALKSYLIRRKISSVSVTLPLPESPYKVSLIEVYETYPATKQIVNRRSSGSSSLLLLFDIFWFCSWLFKNKIRSTVWIGGDFLATSVGLIIQKLHLTRTVILFAGDIVPQRLGNRLLNFIYHFIYIITTKNSDWVWCLSPSTEKLLSSFTDKKIIVITGGPDLNDIQNWLAPQHDSSKLLYMGYLDELKGIDLLLQAFKIVIDQGIDAKLEIVGSGPLENWVENKIKEDGIENYVTLHGFVEDYGKLIRIMSSCCLGLALYKPVPQNYTYFTDPGKVKEYLACGLPVILTQVPEIWKEIEACEAGLTVPWDADIVAKTIIAILSNPEKIEHMRSSAIALSLKYSWTTAFDNAFNLLAHY